ncbi:VOC family protein [Nesterenkonia sandarakina]|uniref:VOC domain-containing protein n=1 Tax=Nesterenkonia sandarakina TaxID=272918 RepID=A0A7Z0EBG8_9MICC|nr:VOC family protein [Nesterenkonia sandarakina]NYJ18130.1 hypothetical protein [Nesterenkonia sandarakina]
MTTTDTPTADRSIYQMPMFATFVVRDLSAARNVYAQAGFVDLATIPGPTGEPQLIHLRRMKYQDLLLVQGEPRNGSTSLSFMAGPIDLNELAAQLRAAKVSTEGPEDTPWFSTDLTITDFDGNRIVLTQPRTAEEEQARSWVAEKVTGDFNTTDSTMEDTQS